MLCSLSHNVNMYAIFLLTLNQSSDILFITVAEIRAGSSCSVRPLLFMDKVFSLSLHIFRDLNNYPPVAQNLLT